jgi:Na+-driven multidrug efflux pump
VIFLIFARPLTALFGDDPTLVNAGSSAIIAVVVTQPLWAITFVLAGALRGAGDTRTPLIITGAMMWLAVAIAFLLVQRIPQLWAVWAAFLVAGPIEAWLYWRAWRGAGLHYRDTERTEVPA